MNSLSSVPSYGSTTEHRIDMPRTSERRSYSSSACCVSQCLIDFCKLTTDFSCVGIWCKYYTVAVLSIGAGIAVNVTVSESNNGPSIGFGLVGGGIGMTLLGCIGCCFCRYVEQESQRSSRLSASQRESERRERERTTRSLESFNRGLANINRGNEILRQQRDYQWQIKYGS